MKEILPVSLILTTLNEEKTVHAFFSSIAGGTRLPAEIVVCDGGSADRTVELLSQQHIDGVEIRVLEEPGATIARGRNTAVTASAFEVLAISDAGCMIDEHWLERITHPLLNDKSVDAVSGGYLIEGTTPFERCASAAEIPVESRPVGSFLPSSRSFAVRKAAFIAAGGYPEHLSFAGEDTALCVKLKDMGKRFMPALDALVTWAPRPTFETFCKQHWLYGVGDGETGLNKRKYLAASAKAVIFLILLALTLVHWAFVFLFPIALVLYYMRLSPLYSWQRKPAGTAACAFMLVITKEIAMLAGFIKGRLLQPEETLRA